MLNDITFTTWWMENRIDKTFYEASVKTNICRNTYNGHSTMFGLLTDTSFLFLICMARTQPQAAWQYQMKQLAHFFLISSMMALFVYQSSKTVKKFLAKKTSLQVDFFLNTFSFSSQIINNMEHWGESDWPRHHSVPLHDRLQGPDVEDVGQRTGHQSRVWRALSGGGQRDVQGGNLVASWARQIAQCQDSGGVKQLPLHHRQWSQVFIFSCESSSRNCLGWLLFSRFRSRNL